MRKIFIFIIINSFIISSIQAQVSEIKTDSVAWWQGFQVELDMASVISSAITYKENYSVEGALQVNLKNKFFPVIEFGYAGADKLSKRDARFTSNGMFGRIGLDFNLRKKKKDSTPTRNLFFAGLRYGFSKPEYTLSNVVISDGYWGGSEVLAPYTIRKSVNWYELVTGVKVEITNNIFMGWTIRAKSLITKFDDGEMNPWYVLGFGKNSGTVWTFNYNIAYRF